MPKKANRSPAQAKTVAASVLTQADADRFSKQAKAWGRKVTRTKAEAKKTLVDLGIYTKDGKLSKNYR